MITKNTFFIGSTGTEIGKTYTSVLIIKELVKKKLNVLPLKPILSGFDIHNIHKCDTAKLLKANNMEVNLESIKFHTPWLYKRAIAPILAAKYEKKNISFSNIIDWIISMNNSHKRNKIDFTLIEGAGGLMVPIENKYTFIDLVKALNIPVILVIGNYIGTISHSLSIIKNLENMGIKIICIVLNQTIKNNVSIRDTEYSIKNSLINKINIRTLYNHNNDIKRVTQDIINFF